MILALSRRKDLPGTATGTPAASNWVRTIELVRRGRHGMLLEPFPPGIRKGRGRGRRCCYRPELLWRMHPVFYSCAISLPPSIVPVRVLRRRTIKHESRAFGQVSYSAD